MPDYALINQYLYEGNAKEVERLVREALAEGRAPDEVLNAGLIAGMAVVGEDFKYAILYVPEVLVAARAMKAGMAVLKPLLTADAANNPPRGAIVIGTVKGDLHDIGKNLVAMMWRGANFNVIDLGTNVPPDRYVAAAREHQANIVGISALLTTTMPAMKDAVTALKAAGLTGTKIVIGGAPVTQEFANEIGADGYAADAGSAVDLVRRLVGEAA